jgi:protein TilB
LTGNPVTQKQGYREFVICALPQLKILDGFPITKSERLKARQIYLKLREQASTYPVVTLGIPTEEELRAIEDKTTADSVAHDFQQNSVEHTPAARLSTARQLLKIREERDPQSKRKSSCKEDEEPRPIRIGPNGRVMQCNEGKYEFQFIYAPDVIQLEIQISKFLDTSWVDLEVQEDFIVVTIKRKLLQLRLEDPINKETVIALRNQSSGSLVVYMAKKNAPIGADPKELFDAWRRGQVKHPPKKTISAEILRTASVESKGFSHRNSLAEPSCLSTKHTENVEESMNREDDWVDDPEVPPLV